MNTVNDSIMRHGQGRHIAGQSEVGPSFLDATFHRAQARLKSNPHCGLRAESSRPLFYRVCAGQCGMQDAVFLFGVIFIATNSIGG